MESKIILQATLDEMDDLFNDTQGGFSIRYYERTALEGDNATFKVVVRHGDKIGYQDGKTFDCQSFIEKFDDKKLRAKNNEGEKNKISLLETDVNIAEQGFKGGLSPKVVEKVLKVYGTYHCKDEKYLKAVIDSEKSKSPPKKSKKLKEKNENEVALNFGR